MTKLLRSFQDKRFLIFVLILLALTDIAIFLDVPILRPFLGFAVFSVVPGFLILHILGLNKLGLTEKVVFSIGLSIAFLLFFGLLVNYIYPALGYTTPLSTTSLAISFTVILVTLAVCAYLRNKEKFSLNLADFSLNTREKMWLLIPACFPLISILGTQLMNAKDNNVALMALFFLIIAYIVLITVRHHYVPERIYPPIIFLISISLMIVFLLRSPHILGADIHAEYCLFQLTAGAQQWKILTSELLDSCLVVSLLPTIYQSFLQLDPEYLYDIIHRIFFAFSPLVVYLISRKYLGNFWAFLATFFFMSQLTFLNVGQGMRFPIAILFFSLAIMTLCSKDMSEFNKRLLFIIFFAAVIVSHYSTAFIFLVVLFLTWIGIRLVSGILSYRRRVDALGNSSSGVEYPDSARQRSFININILALFFVTLFLWYSQITYGPFATGVTFIRLTLKNLNQFFIMESRTGLVESSLGATIGPGLGEIPKYIELFSSWLTIAFIATGVLTVLVRYLYTLASPSKAKTLLSPVRKIDDEFFFLSLAACTVVVVAVVIPFVSKAYDLVRTYFQMMVILAPFFVIGGISIARFLRVRWAYLAILVVLIPYFMSTTGVTYQALGSPRNLTLSSQCDHYDVFYVYDQDVYAAKWLKQHGIQGVTKYNFESSTLILTSQGGFSKTEAGFDIYRATQRGEEIDGYIYLTYPNVVKGKVAIPGYRMVDIAPYLDMLASKNKIYATNGSAILR